MVLALAKVPVERDLVPDLRRRLAACLNRRLAASP
jgi:hypothetical protein